MTSPFVRRLRGAGSSVLALAILCSSGAAQGAGPTVRGVVVDPAGNPLEGATIEIHGARRGAVSGADGAFGIADLRRGRYWLAARRIGYRPHQISFTLENEIREFRIVLEAEPFELPEVVVRAETSIHDRRMQDFLWRSRSSFGGRFLTSDDIGKARAAVLGDLVIRYLPFKLRHTMDQAGGFPILSSAGREFFSANRLSRRRRYQPDCPPAVAVNGASVSAGYAVNDFPPEEVEALEVYREGPDLPIEYSWSRQTACGLVVVWLRSYGRAGTGQ